VGFFEQGLEALTHLPEERATHEQAIDLRLDMRQALVPLGEFPRILDHLSEAEAIAKVLGDKRRMARILSWMAYSYFFTLGDHQRAIETGQRALELGRALDDASLQVVATFYLAYPHQQRGEYQQAVDGLKRVVATLQGALIPERFGMAGYPAVLSRGLLAWCLGDLGAFADGRIYADEAIALAEANNQPWSQGVAQTYLGHFYLCQGDLRAAISLLERCRALVEQWDLPRLSTFAASLLGAAYALHRRTAESVPLLDQAARELAAGGEGTESRIAIPLSEGYLMAGHIDEALRLATLALNGARSRGERGYEAQALRLLAEIVVQRGPSDTQLAETYFGESQALASELAMRPLLARCHLGLGKLHRRAGRAREAGGELATAAAMLRAMDMTLWLPEAEEELAQTTVTPARPRLDAIGS
jgi:tetratricopeptide (TPR) repeat protein